MSRKVRENKNENKFMFLESTFRCHMVDHAVVQVTIFVVIKGVSVALEVW